MTTTLVLELPEELDTAPRAALAEEFLDWICATDAIPGLPDAEIVVTLVPGPQLRRPFVRAGRAIGAHVVVLEGMPPTRNPRWEVAVAYGPRLADEHDVTSWLTTLPHELLHLADFANALGDRVPAECSWAELVDFAARDRTGEEDSIEEHAREISWRWADSIPHRLRDRALLPSSADLRRTAARAAAKRAPRR